MKKIIWSILAFSITLAILGLIIWTFKNFSDGSIKMSDWLAFTGAFLGSVGTIFLGLVTLYQNHYLNQQNLELQQKLFILEYRPQIKVTGCKIYDSLQSLETINESCFFTKETLAVINNSDFDDDVYSVIEIELQFQNLNSKTRIKHIGFVDFVQIINSYYDLCFECPSVYLPIHLLNERETYDVFLSCVCKKEAMDPVSEEYSSIAEKIVNSTDNEPLLFQATMDIENYESVHQKIHIELQVNKENQLLGQVYENDFQYFKYKN